MGAKGTGTTAGTTQATLKGGTSVSLGAQPISLTFTPTSGSGDTTHPSLVVSQGTLTLSSNTISVVNNGPALGAGVYRLIQVTSATTTGVPNTNAVTVTGTGGLAANSTALATVSGGNVILTVTTKSVTSFTGLTGSQTVQASVPNVALSGTISASGPLYPANGETIHVRINGVTQDTTVVGAAGAFSISYATIPPAGGPYPITYTYDGNATLTTATNSATELTVSAQTVPTITAWPTASAITYGQDLTSSTLTGGSASTAGVFTFTAPSTIPSTAGTYAASGTFTPTDTVNFATVVASGVISVSVGTKGLTISSPAVTTKTYTGTAGATITGTLSGVVAGDGGAQINFAGTGTFASSGVANGIAVTSTATLTGTKASSYTLTQPTGLTGNITPATLTVTADNKGRAVGAANPTFTSTTTGFVNSENTGSANVTGAPSLSTTADGTSVEGSYAITCTANTLAAPNYTFTPVDGILYVVGSLTWRAGNGTWDIATSLNWTNSGGATVPYVDAVPTRFDDTATGNPYTVTLNTTVQPGNMTFSGTKDYTITGSGIIGGTASLTNTSGSLTTFTVNNSNSYSGGTFMTAGTVTFGNQYALGSGPVTLTGGMTFQQQGFEGNSAAGALPNAFVLNGTNVTMNMPFGFKDVWLSQVVSGTGGFTVQGGGRQLNFIATNTFSGGIIFKDFNNRIVIWNLVSLGIGTFRTERLSAVEGVLETAANVSTGAGVANAVDIASGAYLNVDASGNNHLLLSGPITSAVGNGNLNKVSSATLTLSGNNTYSGTTTVTGGKLLVNGANSGAGAVSVASAAYLGGKGSVGGNVTYAAGAFGLFTNGSTFAITGTLTLNANVVHLNVPANLGAGNYILATYNPTGSSGSFASTPVLDSGSVYSGGVATVTTTGGNVTLSVSQTASTATLVVGNSPASYTGSPVAATVTISASSVPGTVANVRYDGSATVPTALGTYAITADFVPNSGNYTTLVGLSAGNFVISQAASAIQLVSSSQTNGYLDSVTFTSAVPAFVNSGSVVFLANNGAFSTNDITSGVAYSLAITNQPRGTNLIVAEYPGDANVVGSTNSLLQVVTNHPPVAVEATYSRAKGTSLKIAITNLLSNVTDGDGDAMTLQSVGAGTNGATILTNNTYVFYLPSTGANSNSNDSFTYTVSDGFGGSATANIMVTAYSAAGSAQMSLPTNNVVNIKFFGIPNYTYIVQTTTNLSVPWWTLSTNTAGSDGSWWFTDPNATNSQQYYRSAQP